ncbi:MAG: hypothetical protein Q8S00_32585 [Deltaproteobacteria bacterium]|nr:hypothetical protein [Deltaproteobacteria bacterium]
MATTDDIPIMSTPPLGVPVRREWSESGPLANESFINAIADKVHEKAPSTAFLGIELGGWTRMTLALLGACIVAAFSWYLSVRDALANVEQHGHPVIEQEVRTIRESQIRQEAISNTLLNRLPPKPVTP